MSLEDTLLLISVSSKREDLTDDDDGRSASLLPIVVFLENKLIHSVAVVVGTVRCSSSDYE